MSKVQGVADAGEGQDGVRSLERGLALLAAMNACPTLSVTALARVVGVPRSTAYRLLDTLQAAGYVRRSVQDSGFRLTENVRRLSDGYIDEGWLDAAWSGMLHAGRALFWPLSLFTFDTSTMVIRRTTHPHSSMSIDYGMTGRRMPLIETAAGRAYLAFCPDEERAWLLGLPSICPAGMSALDRRTLEVALASARADGFGRRTGGVMPRTASLSVPILGGGRVLGCVSIVWIASALTMAQAVERLAPEMKALGERLSRAADDVGAATAAAGGVPPGGRIGGEAGPGAARLASHPHSGDADHAPSRPCDS